VTLAIVSAAGLAAGIMGMFLALRQRRLSVYDVLSHLTLDPGPVSANGRSKSGRSGSARLRADRLVGARVAVSMRRRQIVGERLGTRLTLVGMTLEELCAQCVLSATVGFLLPAVSCSLMAAGGVRLSFVIPVWIGLIGGLIGAGFPVVVLESTVKRARRAAIRVVCSFLDMVVLGLAAGMGIESALMTAAQVGDTDISRRIFAALSGSRDTGEPPWEALFRLGSSMGISDLCEIASTAGLAGTEGAKVRSTLAARAASVRRHERAVREAEANAITEKLFLPGALLLLGFLVFIGYPAFTRIASGF
jgi:tight adherence protein C